MGELTELADKRDCSIFLFTNSQKVSFLAQLNPDLFSVAEIKDFNQQLSGDGDEETAKFTLDGIKLLHDNLDKVQNDNQVLLLILG